MAVFLPTPFISDGNTNSRVAKVDKDGNWIKPCGERGSGLGQFNTPHAIATDANGNVYAPAVAITASSVRQRRKFLRQIVIDLPAPPDGQSAIGNIPGEAQIRAGTFAPGSP